MIGVRAFGPSFAPVGPRRHGPVGLSILDIGDSPENTSAGIVHWLTSEVVWRRRSSSDLEAPPFSGQYPFFRSYVRKTGTVWTWTTCTRWKLSSLVSRAESLEHWLARKATCQCARSQSWRLSARPKPVKCLADWASLA